MILWAFVNHNRNNDGTILAALLAHVLNIHINVAVVLVPLANAVQVLLQLRFVEPAGFIE